MGVSLLLNPSEVTFVVRAKRPQYLPVSAGYSFYALSASGTESTVSIVHNSNRSSQPRALAGSLV
jgi:hypothetical protein